MLSLPETLILATASWRLAFMLVREAGPLNVFARLRDRTTLGGMLDCVFCASVWTAMLMWLLWHTIARPVVVVLGVSGAGLMIASWTGVEYRD